MRTITFSLVLFFIAAMFSCSTFDKFAPLSDEQMSQLLAKAKKQAGNRSTDPTAVLSTSEIEAILTRVDETQVDQVKQREIALLETNKGTIAIAFYTEFAPEHTRSFKRLVTSGYYDGTRFHRVVDDFMIQGGDILTRDDDPGNDGTGGPGYTVPAEFNGVPHDLGILSMARTNDPNSAGSQFFICLSREKTRGLDGQYTVFGKVIGGLDVVKTIGKIQTRPNRYGENSTPVEPVYIKHAYMVKR